MKNRREFIQSFSRLTVAAGLAGTGLFLAMRKPDASACSFDFPCGKCHRLRNCNDPKAQSERKNQSKTGK